MYGVRAPAGTTSVGPGRGPLAFLRRTRASSFSPADIAGLKLWTASDATLWQDSARTTPATADGDPVGAWDDASGSGNNLLQATSGLRPLFKLSIVNGKPVVRCDGVDDFLAATFTLNQPCTVCLCYKERSLGAPGGNDVVVDGVSALAAVVVDNRPLTQIAAPSAPSTAFAPANGVFSAVTVEWNGGSSALWENGTQQVSGSAGSNNPGGLTLAALDAALGGGRVTALDVAEVIVYDTALGTTDRQSVESYFDTKYNLGF